MSFRIYTRTGDAGETGLFGGRRVRKDDLRIESMGCVDELNASLGLCRSMTADADLEDLLATVQHTLFDMGADIATPEDGEDEHGSIVIRRIAPQAARFFE